MLSGCVAAYVSFHLVRQRLPSGFVRFTTPSVLVVPLALSVIDRTPGIRFHVSPN